MSRSTWKGQAAGNSKKYCPSCTACNCETTKHCPEEKTLPQKNQTFPSLQLLVCSQAPVQWCETWNLIANFKVNMEKKSKKYWPSCTACSAWCNHDVIVKRPNIAQKKKHLKEPKKNPCYFNAETLWEHLQIMSWKQKCYLIRLSLYPMAHSWLTPKKCINQQPIHIYTCRTVWLGLKGL